MQLTHDIKKLTIAIENQTYIDLKEIKSIDNQAVDRTKYRHGKIRPQVCKIPLEIVINEFLLFM